MKRSRRVKSKHWQVVISGEEIDLSTMDFEYYISGKQVFDDGKCINSYIVFIDRITYPTIEKLFPTAIYIKQLNYREGARPEQIRQDIINKSVSYKEEGILPIIGPKATSNKWNETKQLAMTNNLDDIDAKIFICNYAALKRIASDYRPVPKDLDWIDNPPNEWIYGDTGTGKSTKARGENPGHYLKMLNKWWENYNDEEVVVIEDIGMTHNFIGDFMKIWADKYGFRAEVKGLSIVLRPQKIVVTSNYHPKQIWPDPGIHIPILRRFKLIPMYKNKC